MGQRQETARNYRKAVYVCDAATQQERERQEVMPLAASGQYLDEPSGPHLDSVRGFAADNLAMMEGRPQSARPVQNDPRTQQSRLPTKQFQMPGPHAIAADKREAQELEKPGTIKVSGGECEQCRKRGRSCGAARAAKRA